MGKRYDSILDTVGHTPVVRINNLGPAHVNLYVKVEAFNPMGSVKDRLALGVIEDAERRGELAPGQTVVEATSGNTGIGLAMVCAQKGYPLVVTMADWSGALPGCSRGPHTGLGEGVRNGGQGRGAGKGARLVAIAAVREPCQRRHSRAYHGGRDPR